MSIADLATILAHPWGPGPRPTPTEPFPAPWPDGPNVDGYVDTTPANLGLDGDPVAHALHYLAPFGDLTFGGAVQALGAWPESGKLTAPQVAEVLAYYRPTRLRAVA